MPSLLKLVEEEFLTNLNTRIHMMRKTVIELRDLRDAVSSEEQPDSWRDAHNNYEEACSNLSGLIVAKSMFESAVEETREKNTGLKHRQWANQVSALKSAASEVNRLSVESQLDSLREALLFVLEEMQ